MTVILMIMLVKIVVIDCVDNYHILYTCRFSSLGQKGDFPPSAAQTDSKKSIW